MLTIPNWQTLATTKTMCLQSTNLPQLATTVYCIPNIHNNLLAVSELYDAGCEVTFDKNGVVSSPTELLSYKVEGTYWTICGH